MLDRSDHVPLVRKTEAKKSKEKRKVRKKVICREKKVLCGKKRRERKREKEICDECVIKENRSCEGEFV